MFLILDTGNSSDVCHILHNFSKEWEYLLVLFLLVVLLASSGFRRKDTPRNAELTWAITWGPESSHRAVYVERSRYKTAHFLNIRILIPHFWIGPENISFRWDLRVCCWLPLPQKHALRTGTWLQGFVACVGLDFTLSELENQELCCSCRVTVVSCWLNREAWRIIK